MKKRSTIVVAARIDRELARRFTALAKQHRRTKSNYLVILIEHAVSIGGLKPLEDK
jgi:predicted DNA-binding protein